MTEKKVQCIYKIENLLNGKCYVGSTINKRKRWSDHKKGLRNNKHHNAHLQNSWNKYGQDNFKFKIIEKVDNVDNLLKREQHWIDTLQVANRKKGYNICPTAGNSLGKKHSEETKKKLQGENNSNSKLTKEQAIKIFFSLDQTKKLIKKYNISKNQIKRIRNKEHWSCITKDLILPNEVSKIRQMQKLKCGEENGQAKLTERKVLEIFFSSDKTKDLMKKYNISKSQINSIRRKKRWGYLLHPLQNSNLATLQHSNL